MYQYLQRRYRINGMRVHWEDQPLPGTEARLAGAGIRSVPFRTVANRPIGGDYISEMRVNIKRLEESAVD